VCRHVASIPGALKGITLTTSLVVSVELMFSMREVKQDGACLAGS
jgi:hypothetical protein